MPLPVFEISELAQLIFDHLAVEGSWMTLVSLACVCKAMEEQALRTLWSHPIKLQTLVKSTLPHDMLSRLPPPQVRDITVVQHLAGF